jgi:methionyl-tRNA formyltransferase
MNRELRIVYMGTPDFAVPSLRILVEQGYNVVGVITAPDKPKGRGQKVIPSPVKEYALEAGLTILQPTNLKSGEFLQELQALQANLQVVVAFRMLPEAVWAMPQYGTFNLHASLLPNYRGAAPINWAVINGEKKTGLTTFFLQHEIDTGELIFQEEEPIASDDTAGSLYTRLMHKGSHLVLKTVKAVEAGNAPSQPQPQGGNFPHAPKIFKETCQINWNQPAEKIYNFIRGLSPYPAAWTMLDGKTLKIFSVTISSDANVPAGEFKFSDSAIEIGTETNNLAVQSLQLEGKKRMETTEFLRGFRR